MRNKAAMKTVLGLTIAGTLIAAGSRAGAATTTENLGVGASVAVKCTITTTAIDFGAYDPIVDHASVALDAEGTVTVACTKNGTANIGLGTGLHGARQMSDGTNTLSYELY